MKQHTEDYKLSAVQYYLKHNNDMRDTCKIFDCKYQSLSRWVKTYKKNKTLQRKTQKNHNLKITPEIEKYINNLDDMLQKINQKEKEILKNIDDINQIYIDKDLKGLHDDIQRTQKIGLEEKTLDEINVTKNLVIKHMLYWKTKKQNITLMIDKIFFDNSIMLNKIMINFSKLSSITT